MVSDAYGRAVASQRAAADPDFSVFVTANAGSGKTKVLVDRIARLLLAGSAPSSFVCITYTKAAAAEMQRRLYERLGAWCVAGDDQLTEDLQALIGEARAFEPEMLARARALFARALESPGGLKIQTIHAFCERLLGRFPLEAGVPPGFEIADDMRAAEMRAEAMRHAVDGAEERAAFGVMAARLHEDRLQKALARILEDRVEMRAFVEARQGSEAARRFIADRHGARESAEMLIAACVRAIDWGAVRRAIVVLGESSPNDVKLAEKLEAALGLKDGPRALEALCEAFVKENGEAKAPTNKVCKAEPWIGELFADAGARVFAARDGVRRWERAQEAAAALTLGLKLDGAYAEAKARTGALDFADLIERAHALLTRSSAAAWVLHKLDGGVDHILIDEGQDTSPKQWELLAPLQEEFFAGAGARTLIRTVFAVGDHKQSIYSFQGADPEGFLAQAQRLSIKASAAEMGFAAHNLEMSFRSTPGVLAAVDKTFEGKPLGGDAAGMHDVLVHTAKRAEEQGRVEWWPLAPRAAKREARPWDAPLDMEGEETAPVKLAKEIAARTKAWIEEGQGVWDKDAQGRSGLRAMHAGDVLVLVRSRGPLFRQVLKAFKRAGLPVAGADRMILKDELAVEDCLTLLRVAADPGDDLSLACLIKGPWIGLTDDNEDILPLAQGREKQSLLERLMARTDGKYAQARDFVRQLTEDHRGDGPHALVSWALESLDGEGRSGWERLFARLGEEARDPVEELLARALDAHRRGAATLRGFLAQIDAEEVEVKREMEEAGNAVRVMTVHGAKGLEAPVVFLPDTTGPAVGRIDDCVFMTDEGPVVSVTKRDDDVVSAAARAEAVRRTEQEHLRLLYVAMTRARDRLIVCGYDDGRYKTGAAPDAWHPLVGEALRALGSEIETPWGKGSAFGEALRAETRAPRGDASVAIPAWARTALAPKARADGVAPSKLKDPSPAFSPLRKDAARYRRGLFIHGLMQRLPALPQADRAGAAEAWLTRQGAAGDEIAPLVKETLGIVNDPAFAALFGRDSRPEAPIVGMVRGRRVRGIVDRLVVRPDGVEILDFKSDRPAPIDPADAPDAYVLQMALYREVLAQIFPKRTISCALLWTERPALTRLPPARLKAALDEFFAGDVA
ncbi:MAG: double-strand break repair helicase AddA [Hyphomonadaceae bacterium]|nr:double-strand break repair helicase AddA [Hyphomonadaceae bacterium]